MKNKHPNQRGTQRQTVEPNGRFLINLRGITKTYKTAAGSFNALNNIDLQIEAGKFVAIVGKSGSGKSTLLNMLAGIDTPTSGEAWVGGEAVHTLNQDQLAAWRGQSVGVVFQFFQLLPTLTIIENVMLPMDFGRTYSAGKRREQAMRLLEQVGIGEQANKLPALLSGGERQRAAIARALANDPRLVLADEPTGNLDSYTADSVLQLFQELVASGKTIVMVTHERDVTQWVSRTVMLADGRIIAGEKEVAHV